jgi:hypothetical protein
MFKHVTIWWCSALCACMLHGGAVQALIETARKEGFLDRWHEYGAGSKASAMYILEDLVAAAMELRPAFARVGHYDIAGGCGGWGRIFFQPATVWGESASGVLGQMLRNKCCWLQLDRAGWRLSQPCVPLHA